MKSKRWNATLASVIAVALIFTSASPAMAATASGTRSCAAPKQVTLTTTTRALSASHYYAATGQTFGYGFPNFNVAYVRTSYGPVSSAYTVTASGNANATIDSYSASCY